MKTLTYNEIYSKYSEPKFYVSYIEQDNFTDNFDIETLEIFKVYEILGYTETGNYILSNVIFSQSTKI